MNPLPIRLVLSAEQTAVIRDSGFHFVAGSPVSLNIPTGRATLLLFECSKKTADAAARVALGKARAVKITPPKP
jgi:hypothetical protein